MKHFIVLERLDQEEHRLHFKFSTSLDSLFRQKNFFIQYEQAHELPKVAESIAAIPFAAAMAPVSWATGAELTIPVLDARYAQSLEDAKNYFKKWFAKKWSFSGRLRTFQVRNDFSNSRLAMLFSGGLDSLATYIAHRAEFPLLFTIFGTDIPLNQKNFIQLCRQKFEEFSKKENAEIRYISTDIRDMLNLEHLRMYSENWYGEIAHGLMMSSLIAPLAYDSVKTLMLASCSHRPGARYTCGSEKELVDKIKWAGTSLASDNHEMSRSGKIELLKKNACYSYLRVCWMEFESLNCSRCEKCLRTICELLANNLDPASCNFKIDSHTLPMLKKKMLKEYYFFFHGEMSLDFWRSIQDHIQLDTIRNLYGSRQFFEWFVGFKKIKKSQNLLLLRLYSTLAQIRNQISIGLKPVKFFATVQSECHSGASLGWSAGAEKPES